ncbi:MAG: helix-turn-helix domain-containing protein [Bdellovibrionales bacterium]|nr:helix-turn-helix domain-containing protein [Bdellovibrionales bacterium]
MADLCQTFDYDIERADMSKYRQLTYKDRVCIEVLDSERKCRREVAKSLKLNPSTTARGR